MTCIALLTYRLFFIGIVKTASSKFPKLFFEAWEGSNPVRGDSIFLQTSTSIAGKEHKVVAIGWYCKLIISTCGNCLDGTPQVMNRSRRVEIDGLWATEKYTKQTRRVNIVENMFKYFRTIDVHDHYRQGTLALEAHWTTRTWWHRLFRTILGIIVTDAYFMYRNDYLDNYLTEEGQLGYEEFLGILAHSMIYNTIDDDRNISERVTRKRSQSIPETTEKSNRHIANPLSSHPFYQERKDNAPVPANYRFKARCTACIICSTGGTIVGTCNPCKPNTDSNVCQETHEKTCSEKFQKVRHTI